MRERPLIVNMLGAPGAGKSTTAGEVFVVLKRLGVQVEYVPEFAKDLTWEKRHETLKCQPYILGKQLRNLERLYGQVDVVVTDSPLLLSEFYNHHNAAGRYPPSFGEFVLDQFGTMDNINYLLKRVKPYNPNGRSQNEAESDLIGVRMREFLNFHDIDYVDLDGGPEAHKTIVQHVCQVLDVRPAVLEPKRPWWSIGHLLRRG